MYCPSTKIANDVVDRLRELAEADLSLIVSGLEWFRGNPLPTAEEQYMGIPPDRFLRSIGDTGWLVGYDLVYLSGSGSIVSLLPQEIWVWFIGLQGEVDSKLLTRRSA